MGKLLIEKGFSTKNQQFFLSNGIHFQNRITKHNLSGCMCHQVSSKAFMLFTSHLVSE